MSSLLLFLVSLSPDASPVPRPTDAGTAIGRSLPYLAKSSGAWREQRKCVTCHQVPFALWPLHEARARGIPIDQKALSELTDWSLSFCTTDKHKGEFTGGFLSTMGKMTLALEAAPKTNRTNQAYEFFVPLIAKCQRPDGSFKEGNFIGVTGAEREGIEVDTMWTVLALNSLEKQAGKSLTAAARETIGKSRERALSWLKGAKPGSRTDWLALRMLMKHAAGDRERVEHWRQELLRRQSKDGGWPFIRGGESHPLVTGECLYALGSVGRTSNDPEIRRACTYLISTQEKDGSWRALSRQALGKSNTKKVNAVTTHWGTGWATIGLLRTLPVEHQDKAEQKQR